MADDVTLNAASGTFVAATDDIGSGRQVQLVKPVFGGDGTATMVVPNDGLPVQSGWREVTGSATSNNTDLISVDAAAYRYVTVQTTGTFTATLAFQASNDGTNWLSVPLNSITSTSGPTNGLPSTNTTGIMSTPLYARYFRVRTTSYTSGTPSVVVGLWAVPPPVLGPMLPSTVQVAGTNGINADASSLGGFASVGTATANFGYNGTTWDRWRNPNVIRTVATAASGDTPLWQPGSGNRWRLQRVKFDVTGDASMTGGAVLTITLRDGTTAIGVTQSVYVPATGATTLNGGWTSGWIDLGNGIQSVANAQDLNVNLSAALTTGTCRVLACGTQGAGTAA